MNLKQHTGCNEQRQEAWCERRGMVIVWAVLGNGDLSMCYRPLVWAWSLYWTGVQECSTWAEKVATCGFKLREI